MSITTIIHIIHVRSLLTHILKHLTLLPEDLYIEIRILRPAPVILLAVNPHNHTHKHLNISSSSMTE